LPTEPHLATFGAEGYSEMRDRGDRGRGRGFDSGGSGGGGRDADKKRTPEEDAYDRVYRVWQEVDSASTKVEKLAAIVQRDEWRTERAKLQETHDTLVTTVQERELDAKASARAQEHYTNATNKLGDITKTLANAQEPSRPVPPVAGEETIEPLIIGRSAVPDDVLAWVAGLDARERSAISQRVKSVRESVQRIDTFAVGLANYLGGYRMLSQFEKVAANPREHFNPAAYAKARARREAADAPRADADANASRTAAAPIHNPQAADQKTTATQKDAAPPASQVGRATTANPTASALPSKQTPPGIPAHADTGDPPDSLMESDGPPAEHAELASAVDASIPAPSEVPHRTGMEQSFDRPLGHVKAYTGVAELATVGAKAVAKGDTVAFADASPSPAIVAHEITHTIQAEQAGAAPAMAAGVVGPRHSPAEAEADAMAERVATLGAGVKLPPVVAAPAASVQFAPAQGEPQREAAAPTVHDAAATSSRPTADGKPLNAERYWDKYGTQTMQHALDRAMAELVFEIAGPGLAFPPSECGAFIMSSLGWRMQYSAPHYVSQLLDAPIYELIDGVRVLDDLDRGPDAFEPAVVSRIVERLGLGIRHAVALLALPYAKARSRAVSAAKSASGDPIGRGLGPLQVPQADPAPAQPDPNTLGARTTIEHAVAESMCDGFVEFHPDKFPLVYDTTIPGAPRPAKLELERGRGDWLTVRVVEPANASAVDVANALYGTPELAHLVVGAGNRFSYVFPPGKQLAEPYETEFRSHMAGDGASPLDELGARNTQDPLPGLDDRHADQRALTSAKASGAMATGAGAAPALQRLDILQSVIDSIASAAAPLGVAPIIAPVQARVLQRRAACAADPAEATKWAAHASEQLTLVSDAKAGFDALTEQMFASGLPAVSTASGSELVGDVTASMQGPTRELAAAFAAAVAASEQLDIGRERLAVAKERLAAYPFDMADRMLAVIRKRIASTDHVATLHMKSYDAERMAALEAEIGRTIGGLRIAVVNGDGTAALKLTTLRSQLSMLDLQSTIGSTLTAINELSGELANAESMDPDKARQAWIYDQLHAAMGEWMQFAADYDSFGKAGHARDPATLEVMRTRLGALRSKTDLAALVHELAMYAEDEGKRQRWINIGIMIGAALLAAASGGIASGAIGGVAGSIVGAGIESLTFTAITSTLNQDPSFGGFMAELVLNFATFGGMRAISGGAKFLVGGKALTLPQKLGEMTIESLWMMASAKAQEKIAEAFARGGKVTPQSAAGIFGQQMVIGFASRVLTRVGGTFVRGVVGIEKLPEVQLALAKRTEEEQLARQVLSLGDGKLGEQLVKVDTDVLKAEQRALERVHEVASNPAEAAKHGVTAEPGALERVAADAQGAAREVGEREIAALMAHAEVKADHAIVEPPVYAELLAKHRAQGSTIVEGLDSAGQPHAKITPSLADGSFGKPFTLHQRLSEPTDPAAWMTKLAEGLSADENAKLDKMKHGKTPTEQRAMFDGDLDVSRKKVRDTLHAEQEATATKAQSKVRVQELKREITDKGLMNDPEIRALVDDASKKPKDKLSTLRDKLMAKILKVEAQAARPKAEVIDGVKIYEKLPEATIAEWKTNHPEQKADGLTRRDDGLYVQRGELDMMMVERVPGAKGKIVAREEIKTGVGDTDADAKSQLKDQSDLFKDGASGTRKLRLEVGGRDIAGDIDLASDAGATKSTRGPAGKGFDNSLGVTASDLESLCKDLLKSSPAPGNST